MDSRCIIIPLQKAGIHLSDYMILKTCTSQQEILQLWVRRQGSLSVPRLDCLERQQLSSWCPNHRFMLTASAAEPSRIHLSHMLLSGIASELLPLHLCVYFHSFCLGVASKLTRFASSLFRNQIRRYLHRMRVSLAALTQSV